MYSPGFRKLLWCISSAKARHYKCVCVSFMFFRGMWSSRNHECTERSSRIPMCNCGLLCGWGALCLVTCFVCQHIHLGFRIRRAGAEVQGQKRIREPGPCEFCPQDWDATRNDKKQLHSYIHIRSTAISKKKKKNITALRHPQLSWNSRRGSPWWAPPGTTSLPSSTANCIQFLRQSRMPRPNTSGSERRWYHLFQRHRM